MKYEGEIWKKKGEPNGKGNRNDEMPGARRTVRSALSILFLVSYKKEEVDALKTIKKAQSLAVQFIVIGLTNDTITGWSRAQLLQLATICSKDKTESEASEPATGCGWCRVTTHVILKTENVWLCRELNSIMSVTLTETHRLVKRRLWPEDNRLYKCQTAYSLHTTH